MTFRQKSLFIILCLLGNYQKALETYKDIHRKFPENVECTHKNFFLLYTDSLAILYLFISCGSLSGRFALPGQAVHRYGIKRGAGLCHQTQESGENEGDPRAGTLFTPAST